MKIVCARTAQGHEDVEHYLYLQRETREAPPRCLWWRHLMRWIFPMGGMSCLYIFEGKKKKDLKIQKVYLPDSRKTRWFGLWAAPLTDSSARPTCHSPVCIRTPVLGRQDNHVHSDLHSVCSQINSGLWRTSVFLNINLSLWISRCLWKLETK